MKTIIYIDGQNFLYKVAERLVSANLISDKQEIASFDIAGLLKPLFPGEIEIRYYGVKRINRVGGNAEIDEKAKRFSDNLRRLKSYLTKNGVEYVAKGSLKMRTDEACKNCGFVERHFQEKGVDVGIAIDMVRDAMAQKCDNIALVSSDTDLLPALQIAKGEKVKIFYVAFSGQVTVSLSKIADRVVLLKDKDVRQAYVESIN